jgi:uncharacterized protein (TIGR02147 family)
LRKQKPGPFGMREWAARSGLRSASTISMVIQGSRRLTPQVAEKLAEGIELSPRHKRYLIELSRWESARTPAERRKSQEQLLKLKKRKDESRLDDRHYRLLSQWYVPALYVMAGLENYRSSPEELAKHLGRGITARQVKEALGDLINSGLLEADPAGSGKLRQTNAALTTDEDLKHLAVYRYHQSMLRLAETALELPLDRREMNGLTIPVPESELPLLKDKIRKFRHELNEVFSQYNQAENVYQINIQLFPLTEKI